MGVTADPTWIKFPERCCATVVRGGDEEACDKTAIAVAYFPGNEEFPPDSYPVCKHHARGRDMYALADIIRIVRAVESIGEGIQLEHSTEVLFRVHDAAKCVGDRCTIHNRSDHRMRSFPQHWRPDRWLMERLCPHGIGHPDPDSAFPPGSAEWVHGCDGCCREAQPA